MVSFKLLTPPHSQTKMAKALKIGVYTAALHLQAGTKKTCPFSSPGCRAACLTYAGRGSFEVTQVARKRRTDALFSKDTDDVGTFYEQLHHDLQSLEKYAKSKGMIPACRLNATSDLDWAGVIRNYPNIRFYDYTKSYHRAMDFANRSLPKNWHITFSLSEINEVDASIAHHAGVNIAVPFAGDHLPERFMLGREYIDVIDGDEHDFRPMDPSGVIVGLREKITRGHKRGLKTGFIREV